MDRSAGSRQAGSRAGVCGPAGVAGRLLPGSSDPVQTKAVQAGAPSGCARVILPGALGWGGRGPPSARLVNTWRKCGSGRVRDARSPHLPPGVASSRMVTAARAQPRRCPWDLAEAERTRTEWKEPRGDVFVPNPECEDRCKVTPRNDSASARPTGRFGMGCAGGFHNFLGRSKIH